MTCRVEPEKWQEVGWCTDVFEPRVATRSALISRLTCVHTTTFILLSVSVHWQRRLVWKSGRPLSWHAKCSFPWLKNVAWFNSTLSCHQIKWTIIWELKHATFLRHVRQPEVSCFLFNMSPHHHIYIGKCLFTNWDVITLKIWGTPLSLCEMFTSCLLPWSKTLVFKLSILLLLHNSYVSSNLCFLERENRPLAY